MDRIHEANELLESSMSYLEKVAQLREEKSGDQMLWDEMLERFENRTQKHIDLVKKYLRKIMDLNLPDVSNLALLQELDHDASKWANPERDPYVYINWRYYQQRLGKEYEVPEGMDEKLQQATFHHIKNNKHHPEYWDENVTIRCLNTQDRDKPAEEMVDATSMPLTYVASMMADWLAMSEEKNTDVNDWIKMNVNVRWKFTPQQISLMRELASKISVERTN
jgi:hypothetical protein